MVSVAPALPAASTWLAHENTVFCSVSSPLIVSSDVQEVPEPPIVVASPSIVHTRPVTDSLAVIVSVIFWPDFAYPVLPFEDMTMLSVGCVLSTVTVELSVTADTAVPALPAESLNATENATAPLVSPSATSALQVHWFPDGFATAIELSAIASPPDVKVQVGVPIVSEAVNVRVTTSPLLALPVLSTAMPTAVRVGCVLSIVTEEESEVLVIADAIALPAKSE